MSTRKKLTPEVFTIRPDQSHLVIVNDSTGCKNIISVEEHEHHHTAAVDDEEKAAIVSTDQDLQPDASEASQPTGAIQMSPWAWRYIWAVLAVGVGLIAFACSTFTSSTVPALAFGILFVLASVAQLNKVDGHIIISCSLPRQFSSLQGCCSFLLSS